MPLIDERGRIFGRFNLFDLAMAFVVLGLIPLGYGAYVLFRTPPPALASIEPPVVVLDKEMRFRIHGTNLRPYMRVSLDNNQTRQFLFKDAATAEIVFQDVPPGQYDVVLYDFAQERSRLPKAITIAPPALPIAAVHVAGFLTGVTERIRAVLKPGLSYPGVAEILEVGAPSQDMARIAAGTRTVEIPIEKTVKVPVLLRIPCTVQQNSAGVGECRAGSSVGPGVYLGPPLGPGVYLTFPIIDVNVPVLVTQVRPPINPTTIDVEVKVPPTEDAGELARVGETDIGFAENEFAAGAVVKQAMRSDRTLVFSVPAFPTLTGWDYAGQTLRVGAGFFFVSPRYQLTGTVTMLPPMPKTQPGR
jgi:hypothetical protein